MRRMAALLAISGLVSTSAAGSDAGADLQRQQAELTQALETMQAKSDAVTDEMTRLSKTIIASAIALSGETATGAEARPGLYALLLDAQAALDRLPPGDAGRAAQEQRLLALQKRIAQVGDELSAAKDRVKELQAAAQAMRRDFAQLLERLESLSKALEKPSPPER